MRVFFDSSALVKRYIQEPGTKQVNELFIQANEVFVSVLVMPEMVSALTRNRIEKKISATQCEEQKAELLIDFQDFAVCDITSEVIIQTIDLIEKFSLRTLDAIHLASAIITRVDLFVSSDTQQLKAAAALKLEIINAK